MCSMRGQGKNGAGGLVVASAGKLEPEHFTVSASGVVHFFPDGSSEFYSYGKHVKHQHELGSYITSLANRRLNRRQKMLYSSCSNTI